MKRGTAGGRLGRDGKEAEGVVEEAEDGEEEDGGGMVPVSEFGGVEWSGDECGGLSCPGAVGYFSYASVCPSCLLWSRCKQRGDRVCTRGGSAWRCTGAIVALCW